MNEVFDVSAPSTARQAIAHSLVRAAAVAVACIAFAAPAMAQIYVVVEADGSKRYTNEPVPGAEVFLQTRYSGSASRTGVPFQREIADASRRMGIDARLIEAVIATESAFDPRARSRKGALGLMQLMPDTAERFGVGNVWDPRQNIDGGTAYLRWLVEEFQGDLRRVLAAYNAGEGAVTRYGGVPPYPETRQYVDRVMSYYRGLGGGTSPAAPQFR